MTWCGYSSHVVRVGNGGCTIVCGRPYAMGGGELSFADALAEQHGVRSLEESRDRLVALVDAVSTEAVVFLAHNGPTGLGAERDALWGNDFSSDGGDHGDLDLRAAIDHAHSRGLSVLGVIAGHMHHRLRGGGERRSREERDGVLYLNPARVPRVVPHEGGVRRHHVELQLFEDRLLPVDRWLEDLG